MRLVEVLVMSSAALDAVTDVVEDAALDYTVADRTDDSDASATVRFPVPAHDVESVRDRLTDRLQDLGVGDDIYTVVTDPEAVVSTRLQVRERHGELDPTGIQRIARGELHSQAADMLPDRSIYTLLTAISAVVATAGVLLDSMSVMVGSMVIAPLLGPAMATSVATVLDDHHLFVRGARRQLLGGGVAVSSAVAFGAFARFTSLVPATIDVSQTLTLSNYASPTFLLITVALGAGVAGAISLSTSGSVELIGVMMAAALVPPIGVMGVGVAWGHPTAVVGSAAVVAVNLLSVNLGAIVSLWYLGYHPAKWSRTHDTRSTILRRVLVLAALILGIGVMLSWVGDGTLHHLLDGTR